MEVTPIDIPTATLGWFNGDMLFCTIYSEGLPRSEPINVGQVAILAALSVAVAGSPLGFAQLGGIKLSMYLRILIPVVFSR
jgi:hypothetical protein